MFYASSELNSIMNELSAASHSTRFTSESSKRAEVSNSSHPVEATESTSTNSAPSLPVDPVSLPTAPLHLLHKGSCSTLPSSSIHEILNLAAPLPLDVGVSSSYATPFHSTDGPNAHPSPHPFIEIQRRRAFEKLKSTFTTLLDQNLSAAKLKGKLKPSSGSGKAAFERWHFAVKLAESMLIRDSAYNRDREHRRKHNPVENSYTAWTNLKNNVTGRVEAEVKNLQVNSLPDDSSHANVREPPVGMLFGIEPILMCKMERNKKRYKNPNTHPNNPNNPAKLSVQQASYAYPKVVDVDFNRELKKLGLPDPTNLILDLRRSSDSSYSSFLDSLTKGLQRPSSMLMKGGRVSARIDDSRDGRGKVVALSAFGVSMMINGAHYEKAKAMHHAMGGEEVDVHGRIFSLLCRYDTLEGAGFQAAIGSDVFDSLLRNFDVRMECFASPLNSRYGVFCSAFPDTDCWFGSLGSFFDFRPTRGSYEANPPFVPDFIARMAEHMKDLLSSTEEALSFVVIVPAWKETEGWKRLKAGKFLTHHAVVPQSAHRYREGASYRRKGDYRVASFDTSVFWWQNEAGRDKYMVEDAKVDDLRRAFRGSEEAEKAEAEAEKEKVEGGKKRKGGGSKEDNDQKKREKKDKKAKKAKKKKSGGQSNFEKLMMA